MKKNKNTFSIQKKSSKRVIVILAAVFLLVLTAGIAGGLYLRKASDNTTGNSINVDMPTKEQLDHGNNIKKESVDLDQAGNKTSSGSDPSPPPEAIEGSNKKSVNSEITNINQGTSELHVRAFIQTVTSTGTCTLSMKGPNSQNISMQSEVQPLPSSSTCKGFDISLSKLTSGPWTITIDFSNDNLTSTSIKEFTVR